NWEELRKYLRDRVANTIAPGLLPAWIDALQANAHLLGSDPGSAYGQDLLTGHSDEFEQARDALDIHENSWLIRRLVLGQVGGRRDVSMLPAECAGTPRRAPSCNQ